jgi:hypothetical protein
VIVLTFAATASGCGEESSGSPPGAVAEPTTIDRARELTTIRRTAKRAKREATDGSAIKTCRYITPDGQRRATDAYALRYGKELLSCPQMVRFARKIEVDYVKDAQRATIRKIRLRLPDRATVQFEGPKVGGYGGLVGVQFRKVGSRWRIDDADFVPYGTGE